VQMDGDTLQCARSTPLVLLHRSGGLINLTLGIQISNLEHSNFKYNEKDKINEYHCLFRVFLKKFRHSIECP
jgi:hypothetical protein